MLHIRKEAVSYGKPPSRRQMLLSAGTGLLGLNLAQSLALGADAAAPRAKSVIFIVLYGGPSQLETFDMKPLAPSAIRGPFKPIPCKTPGLAICEHLPGLAAISDLFTVVRTMSHTYNDHSGAGHYIQTGKRWHIPIGGGFNQTPRDWPSMGSVADFVTRRATQNPPVPPYFVLPNSLGRLEEAGQYRRPGEYAGILGQNHNPITTAVDKRNLTDNPYWRDCTDAELTFQIEGLVSRETDFAARLPGRNGLLKGFDQIRSALDDRTADTLDGNRSKALNMIVSGRTRQALDITQEPERLRTAYGRHLFGQSCLMARRLVEAGARFVTVHYDCCDGYSWDSHRNSDDVGKALMPTFDQGTAALLTDLKLRGLLDETMVVAMGEMGRTPKANKDWGRDHWSKLFPALVAGGGVRKGYLHGQSDKDGANALTPPVSPEDMTATIYEAMGIDPEMRITDNIGREMTLVEGGKPVRELFA